MRKLLVLLYFVASLACFLPAALAQEIGANDFRVGSLGDNFVHPSRYPAVAYNSKDKLFLVVWEGEDDVLNKTEIFGQLIDAVTGLEVGENDFKISSIGPANETIYDSQTPAVAYNPDTNRFLVVWSADDNRDGAVNTEFDIFGQFVDAATGSLVGADDFRISDMGPRGDDGFRAIDPSVAYNNISKEFLVVWSGSGDRPGQNRLETEIFGQRLRGTDGAEIGEDDFRISDMGPDNDLRFDADFPDVAFNSTNNEYLVVWSGDDDVSPGIAGDWEIFTQRISGSTGAELGGNDVRISDMGPSGTTLYTAREGASVVYNSNANEYLVVWEGNDNLNGIPSESEIFVQRINAANGSEIGPNDLRISTVGPEADNDYDAFRPDVAYDADANMYLVIWEGNEFGPSPFGEFEIYGQLLASPSLAQVGPDDFRLSDMGPDGDDGFDALSPAVASGEGFLAVWFGDDSGTNKKLEIFGQRVVAEVVGADSDGDGVNNTVDTDDDNDGLSDIEEQLLGTSRVDSDSDDDGVTDGQEISDGSNPLDAGSLIPVIRTEFCAEWNGFLGGMWNIMEHVNLSSFNRSVDATIFSLDGQAQSSEGASVLAGAQTDILVHDMPGWTANSIGKVCSSVTGGFPGDIDGRMVYYKPVGDSFDFAFAMPFQNGLNGSQFVLFNTFQPSLDPVDAGNLVTNWIQLTNLSSTNQTGVLYYYAQDGSLLAEDRVVLSPEARRDFSGHQFGPQLVGMIEWRPDDRDAGFQLRNVRYLYNNPGTVERFDSAFQLEGIKGTGETINVSLDTSTGSAILEVANTAVVQNQVSIRIFDGQGNLIQTQTPLLAPKGSIHIVTDGILNGQLGSASISGTEKVLATAMHYGRTATAGISFLYGIQASQGLGTVLRGSYNTFLGQDCEMLLINVKDNAVSVGINGTRFDGTSVLSGDSVSIPARGAFRYPLCGIDGARNYGVVTLQPSESNSISATIVRIGIGNSYRFSTPVRQ